MTSLGLAVRPLEFFFTRYKRVWRGNAVTSVATPVFYLLALGVGLGVFVDRSTDLPDGVSYLEFVAPGLMAATAMQVATLEASWPVLSAIKWDRQYHAMLASPLRVGDVVIGQQAFFAFRLVTTAVVYFLVIVLFGAVSSPLGVLAIPVMVLVGLAFSAPMAAWAAHTETEVSFIAIFRFLILPMFLFSGTFFPIWSSDMTELVARMRQSAPARPALGGLLIVERNAMVYRRAWLVLVSGFFEPLFYLFFFVYPLQEFIGDVIFIRAMLYSAAYLLVIVALGLVESPWALLALPACFVIGFGFAGAGIAAVTWMRTWKDFDLVQLIMLPMFMFSATFYPISVYPAVLEWVVRCLPLYHGIELVRSLTTGTVGAFQLVNVAYLLGMGAFGLFLSSRRIDRLLLK